MTAAAPAVALHTVVVEFGQRAANDDSVTPPPAAPAKPAPVPTTFTRETVAALLLSGFAGGTFSKACGTERRMVFRLVATGPERTAEDERNNCITVWSMADKGLRRIRLDRLHEIRVCGQRFVAAADLAVAA